MSSAAASRHPDRLNARRIPKRRHAWRVRCRVLKVAPFDAHDRARGRNGPAECHDARILHDERPQDRQVRGSINETVSSSESDRSGNR